MSAASFKETVTAHPKIAWTLLTDLTHLVRLLSARVVEFSALGVTDRLHMELLRLAQAGLDDDGVAVIEPFPTHDELASRISTRREAVNRELRHLEKIGLLERRGNKRIIADIDQLQEMVKQALGE